MGISKQEIEHLLKLARLKVGKKEIEELAQDLARIVEYVGELSGVDTDNIEALAGGLDNFFNVMRNDLDRQDSFCEENLLLDSAPQKEDNYFKVPRILE